MVLTANRPLDDGLVLCLRMSEGVGAKTFDTSKYQNHGIITGASWVDGKYGKALSFLYTSNQYVNVGDQSTLEFSAEQNFSVVAWINVGEGIGLNRGIVSKGHWTDSSGYSIIIDNGVLNAYLIDAEGIQVVGNIAGLADSNWHMVVLVKNGTTATLYADTNSVSDPCRESDYGVNAVPFYIGRSGTRYFNGTIDEVRIYNRALSSEEIKLLYVSRGRV